MPLHFHLPSDRNDVLSTEPKEASSFFVGSRGKTALPKKGQTNFSTEMTAAVCCQHGAAFEVKKIGIPKPGPGEILVKVVASGVCHTDVHAVDGDWPVKSKLPLVPGHEGVGYVVALGDDVDDLAVGDRVGVPWLYSACGKCEHCITGWETLCEKQQNCGYSVDGGFAQYILAKASHIGRIPEGLDLFQAAPIMCAGVTTYKGLKETEVKPGDTVAILGAGGGLGHLAVQYAKAMGMKVCAMDVSYDKLELCRMLGADYGVLATDPDAVDQVIEVTGGGAHGALCLATSPVAFKQSVNLVRRRGTAVCVGLPPGDFATPIFDIVLKRVTIRGSIVGTRKDLEEALQFAADGKVQCVIQKRKLAEINEIFGELRAGQVNGRIVLDMTE